MDTNTLAVIGVVLVLLVIAGVVLARRRRSDALKERFGPEYHRTLHEMGSASKAEAELLARQKRVEKFAIVALSASDAERFTSAWHRVQERFVDSPDGALFEADELVRELMMKRGYPMGDFDARAADISVHHPDVVHHYREGHDIALRHRRGEADTESLRQALVHYRALFAELLEVAQPASTRNAVERDLPKRDTMPVRDHAFAEREKRKLDREGPR